jgi:polysaccharide pyruvyl transferase WcaK-like protein
MSKVVLFNVKYSPNLGDGVIAECLEHGLRRHGHFSEVRSIDLAGRVSYTPPSDGNRRAMLLSILDRLPEWARDAVVMGALGHTLRRRLRPAWRQELEDTSVAVIGGGQLIQDGDLNFPMKLSAAAAECARRGLPVAVHAVGVARSRSFRGRQMLEAPLRAAADVFLSVRDLQSTDNLGSFGFVPHAVCGDPGLLASRVWPMAHKAVVARPVVGICITHPAVLRHHSSDVAQPDEAGAIACYGAMVESLVENGFDVLCFTNGAGEDEVMLQLVRGALAASASPYAVARFASRAATPQGLAKVIAGLDALVAHRLHAAIVAYSYGIPVVGLRWDNKLAAFFDVVGLGGHTTVLDRQSAATMHGMVAAASRGRTTATARAAVIDRADGDIRLLAEAIMRAIGLPQAEQHAPRALRA